MQQYGLRRKRIVLAAFCGALTVQACSGEKPFDEEMRCILGGYQMSDGRVMGLAPRSTGDLRYVFVSGESGSMSEKSPGVWSTEADAPGAAATATFDDCADGRVKFNLGGSALEGDRIAYVIKETKFAGVDGERAGRLVLPPDGKAKAIVVSIHGSERWSGRTGERLQTLMPAYGIGVFAYDKRGTGESEGKYTQDFDVLAGDAVLAAKEARRLYGESAPPIGYWGGSQGGWIGPLAALKGGADFVIAAYGMAEGPLAEDREEVMQSLRRAGYGEAVLADAREVTDATGRVMASDFKGGFEELDAVKKKYKGAEWLDAMEGEFSDDFMSTPNGLIRIIGPILDVGTSWEYEPRPTLEAIDAPQLWILAGEDTEAPHERTLAILREIQPTKPRLDIVVFPNTEHGIQEFVVNEKGERTPTRYAEGYYELIRNFILTGEPAVGVEGPIVYRGSRPPTE